MEATDAVEHDWPYLLSFLPEEEVLEQTARERGAIRRRRAVKSAATLLRLVLVYGFCGSSLRQTAAWAEAAEVATLSDVALMKRLRNAAPWLGHLLGLKLMERLAPQGTACPSVRLIDATTVSAPGSQGTDWRVHLDFDLGTSTISEVQVTSAAGGETLLRYAFEPGELVIADRGYSLRPGLAHVIDSGADFIVRLNWSSVPLQERGGESWDLLTQLRRLPEAEPGVFELEIKPDPKQDVPAIPVRLVALRKSEAAAQEARRKVLHDASKRRRKLQPQTLELAGYVLVLTSTTTEAFSAHEILELYRYRWQIEMTFKRLKSLLALDTLPAKDPDLARTFLFSKLLAALLVEDLMSAYLSFSPWGYRLHPPPPVPLAHPASAPPEHELHHPRRASPPPLDS
jgi:hypothetical protein